MLIVSVMGCNLKFSSSNLGNGNCKKNIIDDNISKFDSTAVAISHSSLFKPWPQKPNQQ